ncbi:MAG: DUF1249 domain-containing protein [Gammaproteobacteria bacterium]|nr:DUF1249 domain-containing protein [Gammaproteobacteria bacterium]
MRLDDRVRVRRFYSWARVYEINHRLLLKLIPELKELPDEIFLLDGGSCTVAVSVVERCKFTTSITLSHDLKSHDLFVINPSVKIRIYHDARLAEVVACQQDSKFFAVYPFILAKVPFQNEKRDVNLFLREWLNHCLAQGYTQKYRKLDF